MMMAIKLWSLRSHSRSNWNYKQPSQDKLDGSHPSTKYYTSIGSEKWQELQKNLFMLCREQILQDHRHCTSIGYMDAYSWFIKIGYEVLRLFRQGIMKYFVIEHVFLPKLRCFFFSPIQWFSELLWQCRLLFKLCIRIYC